MSVIPIQSLEDELCIATLIYKNDDSEMNTLLSDSRFISIIDKCIAQLSEKDLNSIIINNVYNQRYHLTLIDFCLSVPLGTYDSAPSAVGVFYLLNKSRR